MKRILPHAWIAVLLACGMAMAFYPTFLSGFQMMQTGFGDTRFNNYVLEHEYRWVRGDPHHRRLWDPPFFYPAPNTLAYSDVLLTVAPFYAGFRVMGLVPDTAFQAWTLLMGLLNIPAAFLLFRRALRLSAGAAAFGAFLVGFGSPRLAQLSHLQLLPHFYTLGALISLAMAFRQDGTVTAGRRRLWIFLFSLCVASQLYASFYLGYFLLLALVVAAAWTCCLARFRRPLLVVLRMHRLSALAALALGVAAIGPLAAHYLAAGWDLGFRSPGTAERWLPRLHSWIYMGKENWVYGRLQERWDLFTHASVAQENCLGIGLVTSILVVLGLWRGRHRGWVRLVVLVSLTLTVGLTVFPGNLRLWRVWYYMLPGMQSLRAVSRIGILMLIPAGAGLALFVDSAGTRRKKAIAYGLALVCCVEQGRTLRSYDKSAVREDVVRLRARIDPRCRSFLYVSQTSGGPVFKNQLDAMWAGLDAGVPTLNGYSGNEPENWPFQRIRARNPRRLDRITKTFRANVETHAPRLDGSCMIGDEGLLCGPLEPPAERRPASPASH